MTPIRACAAAALAVAAFAMPACSSEASGPAAAAAETTADAAPADAQATPASSDAAGDSDAVETRVQCSSDDAKPQACRMRDAVGADAVTHTVTFEAGGTTVRFVGKAQGGWWSGTLDGQPAMGYEKNRGHVVYSTADLSRTFAWWSPGSEHGAY